jgi:hypothetical protein
MADSGQMSDNYLDHVYLVSVAAQRRALVLLLLLLVGGRLLVLRLLLLLLLLLLLVGVSYLSILDQDHPPFPIHLQPGKTFHFHTGL